jgi:hypothetical protein
MATKAKMARFLHLHFYRQGGKNGAESSNQFCHIMVKLSSILTSADNAVKMKNCIRKHNNLPQIISLDRYFDAETEEFDLIAFVQDLCSEESAPPAKRRRRGGPRVYDPDAWKDSNCRAVLRKDVYI